MEFSAARSCGREGIRENGWVRFSVGGGGGGGGCVRVCE